MIQPSEWHALMHVLWSPGSHWMLMGFVFFPLCLRPQAFLPGGVRRSLAGGEVQRGSVLRPGHRHQTRHLHLHRRDDQHSHGESAAHSSVSGPRQWTLPQRGGALSHLFFFH